MTALPMTAVVPEQFYVHRAADRQLRRVIEEMGRPGYVLVARQMGKTNMLLHAKRSMQQDGDVFAYVDLSSSYGSARECFRSIVDAAVDSHENLEPLRVQICAVRDQHLPEYKEHELELRLILRLAKGKVVIILDEVDALTNASFSDQIFSQIRSTYFSRTNVPEYARLTYVLSGVAEPSELIKNTKLSPFNIGEKIYLDDFSVEEFRSFVRQSGLALSDEAQHRIYHWVSGNPRMTWDICSALADTGSGCGSSAADVDLVVRKLFLDAFDRPPIDHIRNLVADSSEMRSAIVEMRFGKGFAVSDAARTRLYLAGIVSASRESTAIRNRVVDASLSDSWLAEVERRKGSSLAVAQELSDRRKYAEAIAVYEEFLLRPSLSYEEKLSANLGLSRALYSVGDFAKAITALQHERYDEKLHGVMHFEELAHEGLCLYGLGRFEEATVLFERVVAWNDDGFLTARSMANLATCRLRLGGAENLRMFRDIAQQTLSRVAESTKLTQRQRDELLVATHSNMARSASAEGRVGDARVSFETALSFARNSHERAVLLYELTRLETSAWNKRERLRASVDAFVDKREAAQAEDSSALKFTHEDMAMWLAMALELDEQHSFEKLFEALLHGQEYDATAFVALHQVILDRLSSAKPFVGRKLVARMLEAFEAKGETALALVLNKSMAHQSRGEPESHIFAARFLRGIESSRPRSLDRMDFDILSYVLSDAVNVGNLTEAKRILELVEPLRTAVDPEYFVVFDYSALMAAAREGDARAQFHLSRSIVEQIERLPSRVAARPVIRSILATAVQVVSGGEPMLPAATFAKAERNQRVRVRYANGRVVTAKFKKVEGDIRLGRCVLLSNE